MKIDLTKGILDIKGTPTMVSEGSPFTLRDTLLVLLNGALVTPKESFSIPDLGKLIADESVMEIDSDTLGAKKLDLLRRVVKSNRGYPDKSGQYTPYPPIIHVQVMKAVGLTEDDV